MAGEGGSDFFLNFGSDAAPFARQIANDLDPGIVKINELREALARYEAQAATSKAGSSPLGLTFEGLDAAATKIEEATAGFSTKVESSIAKFVGVAEQLEQALRSFRGVNPTVPAVARPGVRPGVPASVGGQRVVTALDEDGNPVVIPLAGTGGRRAPTVAGNALRQNQLDPQTQARVNALDSAKQKAASVAAVTNADVASAQAVKSQGKRTSDAADTLTSANTVIGTTAKSLAKHLGELDAVLKTLIGETPSAADRRKARLADESDPGRAANNVAAEVQIGNTPANPIPVIVVGGEAQAAGGHPHLPAHMPTATTATSTGRAKDALEVVPEILNAQRGTRKNPRPLLSDEQPYDPSEYVYPLGGDPKKPTRAFGLRPGETFGQYSNRVGAVQARTNSALGAANIPALTPEEEQALKLFRLSGQKIPKAVSTALGQDKSGGYLSIQSARAVPPGLPPEIAALVSPPKADPTGLSKLDEIARQTANAAHPAVLSELLRDPHLTQDGLDPAIKSALSRIDKIMLNPDQGLGRGDAGQDQRVLQNLFGNKNTFNEDDVNAFQQGATRRQYIRDNGANSFVESRDISDNQRYEQGKYNAATKSKEARYDDKGQLVYGADIHQAQADAEVAQLAEINARKNSVAGQNAARQNAVRNAGARFRNAQGFVDQLEGRAPFRDPAKAPLSEGLITEGEAAQLRSAPAAFYNPDRDAEEAQRRLRNLTGPTIGGLRERITRTRNPQKLAGLQDTLATLTPKNQSPEEINRVAQQLAAIHNAALQEAVAAPRAEEEPVVPEPELVAPATTGKAGKKSKKKSSRAATADLTSGSNIEPVEGIVQVRSMDEARRLAATDEYDENSVHVPDGKGGWQSLAQATSGGKGKKKRSSRAGTPKASKASSAEAALAAPEVDDAEAKMAAANAEYAQTLNEELAAVRQAIKTAQNEIRNLKRRQASGGFGSTPDDEAAGQLAALEGERDRLKAELKNPQAAAGGGGNKPPVVPPAPSTGANPEPEPEPTSPQSTARLFPVPGTVPGANQQTRLGGLGAETQAALAAARTALANPATSIDNEASRAAQQSAIVRAAAAFRADPESARFKGAADKSTAFAQALGLDTNDQATRAFLRRQVLNQGGLADQFNDARRLRGNAQAEGAGEPGATGDGKIRSASGVQGETGQETAALKAQIIAANNLESALERLSKVQANTASTAVELRDAENGVARAEIQSMTAARNVAAAQEQTAKVNAAANGNQYQRITGRSTSFGKDLIRHGTNALENTIGYTLVFTGFEKLKEVVHTGLEADAAFVRLKASLDANGVSAGNLQSNLAQISATTATPLEHVIEAASELAGTFKDAGTLAFATNISAQLANISQGALTAKEAAVGLRDVVSAFGQDWNSSSSVAKEKIQETGDQIAHLSQLTGVSVKDITEGTTQIAAEAHDFGLNQRQSATLAAYVTQGTGESGEQSASQLSRMLSSLYNGKAQTQLIKLGIATPEEFQSGKIGEVLTNLISKYNGLNSASKQSVAALLGTGIQARAFAALMNGGAAAVKELNGQMDDSGSVARQNQAYLNTVAGSIKQLSEDFQNLGSTLAHLGAFDAIGILANALDKLFKEFNKVFGGLANIFNSNPITATMMHFTAVILEAAAAWKVFGGAATTALVRTGAVSAAQLGVGVKNAADIERATATGALTGAAAPAARYERARFAPLITGLGTNARGRAAGILTPGGRAATREAAAGAAAAREAAVLSTQQALLVANRELTQAEIRESEVVVNLASTDAELLVASENAARALEAVAVAAAAAAEANEANAAANTQGALSKFFTGGFTSSPLGLAGLGIGVALAGTYVGGGIANKHYAAQSQADDALLKGSSDSSVYANTQTPTGVSGFADQYLGKGNFFQHLGNAAQHTGEGFVNNITGLLGFHPFSGGQTGPSDKSSNQEIALLNEVYNQSPTAVANSKKTLGFGNATKTGIDQLKNLKSSDDVNKWLKAESDFIDKHAKDIEKAGGNDKNSQAQIAFNINQLKANLTTSAQNRLAAIEGLSQIDKLNSSQSQLLSQATGQVSQFSRQTLLSNPDAAREILDNTGVPTASSEYKNFQKGTNAGLGLQDRQKALLATDQANLKSTIAQLDTVGNPHNGLAVDTDAYKQLVQSRDTLLTQIQQEQQNLVQEPVQLAQNLAGLYTSTGQTGSAVGQLNTAITGLQNINSKLDKDDPQFIANLQTIQQLKLQVAQTAIIPQLNKLQLTAANTSDPVVQARANYAAAQLQLEAANKAYQAEYNDELLAVQQAQASLDDFLKQWDGHARGSQIAIIQKLEAALGVAKGNLNTSGTDPAKQMAQLANDQAAIQEASVEEQLKEAQYTAQIAGIRNATSLAQAQLTGLLQQQSRIAGTGLDAQQKQAELQAQEIQLRAQIRDDKEADKESTYDLTSAIDKAKGDDIGSAQAELTKAKSAYAYAISEYGKKSKQANDAYAQLVQASADFQDSVLAQINSNLELEVAQLTARGQTGDLYKASEAKVQEAQNALQEYLKKGGKKGTSTYNQLLGTIATAQRTAFDQQLQDQLDTLDFQQQTYQITSSQEVQSLQQILKNKQLTLQEQRDITLKIKNLQESIRQQLTQGGLNIPSNITLPTAYDVRRSLGAGFAGASTQVNTVNNNNQQIQINNNVPNAQVAATIASTVIDLINQQTSMGLRATSSTPRTVPTR